jgi:hypothetical protein
MRRYTVRERVLSGIAGGVISFFLAFPLTYLALTDGSLRAVGFFCAAIVLWGIVGVFGKIAFTGTSATFIDQAIRPRGLAGIQPPRPSLVSDILNAILANFVALVLGMASGPFAIAFPLGIFGVYMLLVAAYAWLQLRKGRRQRGILAGAIAPIVTIVFAMNVRIA